MKFLILLSLLLPAVTQANITARQKHLINKGASNASVQLGTLLDKTKNLAVVTWDYSVDGGAVSTTITPAKTVVIPDNAIITRTWAETITRVDSPGTSAAMISVGSEAAGDILASVDVDSLTAGAIREGVSTGAASLFKKMSADRTVTLAVASYSALSSGKIDVYIEYVLGN